MWKCYFREKAKFLEQQGKAKGFETSQDQIFGKDTYANPQTQALYDEQILSLYHKAYLNVWDRIQELGKLIESLTRVKLVKRVKHFSDFLQTVTKAIQIGVKDPDARQELIESLAFENANLECKKFLGL